MSSLTSSPASIEAIEARIAPLRARLQSHPLYASIRTPQHMRIFMQSHVFAVWDFMSLLKALQNTLTCVSVPWKPSAFPQSRRFINEIVLGEESDLFEGRALSHFELYLEAMQQAGADVEPIEFVLQSLAAAPCNGTLHAPLAEALTHAPAAATSFVQSTFALIEGGSLHAMAAAFTFGREDLIPDMFRAFVRDLSQRSSEFAIFAWYLERHIEVDGDDHGPLSLRMVADLCGSDEQRWTEAAAAAEAALQARLSLWDAILHQLQQAQ